MGSVVHNSRKEHEASEKRHHGITSSWLCILVKDRRALRGTARDAKAPPVSPKEERPRNFKIPSDQPVNLLRY
jgi:hypothetical protein